MEYHRYHPSKKIEFCQTIGTSHIFPKHCHESVYILGLMECGASYCVGEEDSTSIVNSNEAFLINPGQVHSGIPITGDGVSYSMMSIDNSVMSDIASDLMEKEGMLPEFDRIIGADRRINHQLRYLLQSLQSDGETFETDSDLTETLSMIISQYSTFHPRQLLQGEERKRIQCAKDYLASRLDEKMTLDEVARQVGLSQYYFIRLFKKQAGVSPHVYRTQQRLDAAKVLLRKGHHLSEIALSTGFNDQSHFTNTFKAYLGITPGQYLK